MAVLAIDVADCAILATLAAVSAMSATALPTDANPATMPPMLQPSETAMMAKLTISAAAILAPFLLMPDFSSDSAIALTSLSVKPVSLMTSADTATTAPAMANAAAAPPVTTVVTIAAATAMIAPSHPKMRLARRDFAASSIFLSVSSILPLRSLCSAAIVSFWTSMRSFAISA